MATTSAAWPVLRIAISSDPMPISVTSLWAKKVVDVRYVSIAARVSFHKVGPHNPYLRASIILRWRCPRNNGKGHYQQGAHMSDVHIDYEH